MNIRTGCAALALVRQVASASPFDIASNAAQFGGRVFGWLVAISLPVILILWWRFWSKN
ncbi:MAG: hypothetical protein K8T26_19845 [Lentisphaerae bacterium]|nr:hypothetical protein [Lentisphaerota bacterium]